ncbi:MAG: hypothetical protein H0X08_10160 [Blastocatellia bacterium]|nr:hypothetical protein [Blastocatellia bacterium]
MKIRPFVALCCVAIVLMLSGISMGQVKRPFRDGPVWDIAFIKMKPGMETAYLNYIATDWKKNQEASKKAGIIRSYKVITSEPHNPGDFNIMLMTEYKDLATMEANTQKADDLAQTVIGPDEVQMEGYRKRLEIREVLGNRLSREIILEPKGNRP